LGCLIVVVPFLFFLICALAHWFSGRSAVAQRIADERKASLGRLQGPFQELEEHGKATRPTDAERVQEARQMKKRLRQERARKRTKKS
jgi:hypothetical protein